MASADHTTRPIRIGNCSGFYGDRLTAMREMLTGGPLDVLTGDYLAELTMLILGRDQLEDASVGYAKTFLRQLAECLDLALERGVRIVANAGGLNPAGLAEGIGRLGTSALVAYVDGDDLRGRPEAPGALTANAYLGAFGIARALDAGADVVVTGRVTDASLVIGPAIAHHGWTRADLDALAGATVAGHVVECGAQATGGNFAGFTGLDLSAPLGFPIAEVAADGSAVITKHPGTGGAVTPDTVTAQLLYEVQGPLYLGPDVSADLTSIRLAAQGEDRVAITGVIGQAPPARLKVAVNELGGWRNRAEFVLTGLDLEAKAALVRAQLAPVLEGVEHRWATEFGPVPTLATESQASALLRLDVYAADAETVGRAFTAPVIELALASYPGFHVTRPPERPTPYGVFRARYVDRDAVTETVHLPGGSVEAVPGPTEVTSSPATAPPAAALSAPRRWSGNDERVRIRPLGDLVFARSGDKGGDANLGLWIPQSRPDAALDWLYDQVDEEFVRDLVPGSEELDLDLHRLPNLRGLNIVLHGWLDQGVAQTSRFDPQAKALGEWVRSRRVPIPIDLVELVEEA
ncbi:MAG: DUF1446 domain-containing protein [Nocardioides sp.]|uniref:acyclic terpene utilization AtuA family protein n=1 Tax=Nocardioides sp. TaxID=35761 RepID=UPI0039E23167